MPEYIVSAFFTKLLPICPPGQCCLHTSPFTHLHIFRYVHAYLYKVGWTRVGWTHFALYIQWSNPIFHSSSSILRYNTSLLVVLTQQLRLNHDLTPGFQLCVCQATVAPFVSWVVRCIFYIWEVTDLHYLPSYVHLPFLNIRRCTLWTLPVKG